MEDLSMMILNVRDMHVHVHMPEGSISKGRPSMGIALLSAFVSLFTKMLISLDIAMTGKISLIGGLEKEILAVHSTGIKMILAPTANRADTKKNKPESIDGHPFHIRRRRQVCACGSVQQYPAH